MAIRVTPLGAGRQVGRSCILVELADCRVLLDCGVNVGARDESHAPELDSLCCDGGSVKLDAVVISHFHSDHIAALPYLTEVLGYSGPVLMTHPTRAFGPMIVEEYLRRQMDRRGKALYTMDHIQACFAKATCLQLEERVVVRGLAVTPFYAGHVIGAAMILLEYRGMSALYTGDFTTVPDHHLSAARLPLALRPDVMITESTYCTTIRSSKRAKEQELCTKIQEVLEAGGKVLMPIFMMGRAQEMAILCEKHWERSQLNYPIYIVRGLAEKALTFLRLFSSWASESLRKAEEPFSFTHVKMCDVEDVVQAEGPMVVFAGPSMLQGGASLQIFQKWAPNPHNLVVFAGYCLPGTPGNDVQAKLRNVKVDAKITVSVRCGVEYMSHSDHTDLRGIIQLIAQVAPRNVVLVHGTEKAMQVFRPMVQKRLRIPCFDPGVGESVELGGDRPPAELLVSPRLVVRARPVPAPPPSMAATELPVPCCPPSYDFSGVLVRRKRGPQEAWHLIEREPKVVLQHTGLRMHRIRFSQTFDAVQMSTFRKVWADFEEEMRRVGASWQWQPSPPPSGSDIPQGATLTALVLADMRCSLCSGEQDGVVRLALQWTREDEAACPAVQQLLVALEEAA